MERRFKFAVVILFIVLAGAGVLGWPGGAWALSEGPPLETTGAPGENTCIKCHKTYGINSGMGGVTIEGLPERYVPGASYPVTVRVSDPNASAWGFQVTALTEAETPAGVFQSFLENTWQALGPSLRLGRNYAQHTQIGTYPGQAGGASWALTWRAPSEDVGPVRFYLCGNAGNNDHTDFYDRIYSTSVNIDGQRKVIRVTLDSPQAGARIGSGEPLRIRWTATDGDTASAASFRVLLSTDGGENFPTVIASGLASDARFFIWNVPEALSTASARLRVVAVGTDSVEHRDTSQADLTIGPIGLDEVQGALVTPAGTAVRSAGWGDYDRDGRPDVAVGRESGRVYLYRQTETGAFSDVTQDAGLTAAGDARAMVWGDPNGDGLPDLAVVRAGATEIYQNTGGAFTNVGAPTSLPRVLDPRAAEWFDADSDGLPDLVVVSSSGVSIARSLAAGGFEDATGRLGFADSAASAIAPGPLVAIGYDTGLRLYRREGGANVDVTQAALGGTAGGAVRSVVWADINSDGRLDVVTGGAGGVHVFAESARLGATGERRFEDIGAALDLGGIGDARAVAPGDYDGDGDQDLFIALVSGPARVLRNDGGAGFADVSGRFVLDGHIQAAVWIDVDGDASKDLATVAPSRAALFDNPRAVAGAARILAVTDSDGDASAEDGQVDVDAVGAWVIVDVDGDGAWPTGSKVAHLAGAGGLGVVAAAPGGGPVLVRVEFPDGEAVERPAGGADFMIVGDPRAAVISGVKYSAAAKGPKLTVDGTGLPVVGAGVEIEGTLLATIKAPAKFRDPDGTSRRLVGKDPGLASLVASRPVRVRVLDTTRGVLSAPFVSW